MKIHVIIFKYIKKSIIYHQIIYYYNYVAHFTYTCSGIMKCTHIISRRTYSVFPICYTFLPLTKFYFIVHLLYPLPMCTLCTVSKIIFLDYLSSSLNQNVRVYVSFTTWCCSSGSGSTCIYQYNTYT